MKNPKLLRDKFDLKSTCHLIKHIDCRKDCRIKEFGSVINSEESKSVTPIQMTRHPMVSRG